MTPALLRLIPVEHALYYRQIALIFRITVLVLDMRTQQMNVISFFGAGSFSTSWNGFSTLCRIHAHSAYVAGSCSTACRSARKYRQHGIAGGHRLLVGDQKVL